MLQFLESQSGLHGNRILSIPASLKYAGQLTDGLAFFLGVNLPHKIDYRYVFPVCAAHPYQIITGRSTNYRLQVEVQTKDYR